MSSTERHGPGPDTGGQSPADVPAGAAPRHLLPPDDLAALTALSERGLLHAGESLSALLGHGVRLRTSGVSVVSLDALPAFAAQATSGRLGGLQFQIAGEGSGCLVVLFPMSTIVRMLEAVLGRAPQSGEFTDLERSAIREIGNVLASSFLSELGDATQRRLLPSPPRILLDDLEPVMAETRAALAQLDSRVVVIQGLFEDPVQKIEGRFFILPEVDSAWKQPQA